MAEEARVTAETMGNEVDAIHDIGVAGIHRLMAHRERLAAARVVIVCAGMEGALPSVIGGLVAAPVIAGAAMATGGRSSASPPGGPAAAPFNGICVTPLPSVAIRIRLYMRQA